jgi:hypothetical protein
MYIDGKMVVLEKMLSSGVHAYLPPTTRIPQTVADVRRLTQRYGLDLPSMILIAKLM